MKPAAILLCAGEGTRMNDTRTHKVCYEIAGTPAIIRLINNLKTAGVERFVVVVGSRAQKVMECTSGVEGVVYAFQPTQNGTGSAALVGLRALLSTGYEGPALIAMGDKIIAPDVIARLTEQAEQTPKAAVFAVQPKAFNKSGGRIVEQHGKVYGIVEQADSCLLALGALGEQSEAAFSAALGQMEINEKKRAKILKKALEKQGSLPAQITLGGESFTAGQIEDGRYVNTATYLLDARTAAEALARTGSDNAQGELYLTDAVNEIAAAHGAHIVVINEKEKLLTYSTMDELLQLHRYFEQPEQASGLPSASEWINRLSAWQPETKARFEEIYGDADPAYLEERKAAYIALLRGFIDRYGDKGVIIVRAPGRVNLLGRHIEHRGGCINVMSIDRETLLVAAPREDDTINLKNIDPAFASYEFSILQTLKQFETKDWIEYIESDAISQMVLNSRGEWVNYVKAGILRLQMEYHDRLLRGMDMLFSGGIPVAAGLSSSSSIVVATTEAIIALNGMDVHTKEFIHLCGEGEWFVGSRGGAGDHAAVKCGKRGRITQLTFFPFDVKESVAFPDEYQIVVANSFIKAQKSGAAKDQFNQKVACYEFGLMLIKKLFPRYRRRLQYLRDINPETLDIPQSKIYEILLKLPERMTSEQVHAALPEYEEQINQIQKSHAIPPYYEVRSACLYGIAECMRAEKCVRLLKEGDYSVLGRLMNISHDGDRVWKNGAPYDYSAGDDYLRGLIADLRSEEADRVARAQIFNQPGGYGCSTPVIDDLVDFINTQPGVLGAELSGAGLGGCVIILVKKESSGALLDALKAEYYDKNNLPMGAQVFVPVAGSLVL